MTDLIPRIDPRFATVQPELSAGRPADDPPFDPTAFEPTLFDDEPTEAPASARPWLWVGLVLLTLVALIVIGVVLGSSAGAAGDCGGG